MEVFKIKIGMLTWSVDYDPVITKTLMAETKMGHNPGKLKLAARKNNPKKRTSKK